MRKEKNKKIGVIIFTLFISLTMILSIFAIVLDNQDNSLKYNGFKFSLTNDGYRVKINNTTDTFQYYPAELENFNLSQSTKDLLSNSVAVALLFDPNSTVDDLSYIDYARFNFDNVIDKPVYFGITQESEGYTLPVLTCENATAEIPFIVFNSSSETSIVENNNCIILNAKLKEILAVEERIAYQMLGVMK
jgi:hypothetical protein